MVAKFHLSFRSSRARYQHQTQAKKRSTKRGKKKKTILRPATTLKRWYYSAPSFRLRVFLCARPRGPSVSVDNVRVSGLGLVPGTDGVSEKVLKASCRVRTGNASIELTVGGVVRERNPFDQTVRFEGLSLLEERDLFAIKKLWQLSPWAEAWPEGDARVLVGGSQWSQLAMAVAPCWWRRRWAENHQGSQDIGKRQTKRMDRSQSLQPTSESGQGAPGPHSHLALCPSVLFLQPSGRGPLSQPGPELVSSEYLPLARSSQRQLEEAG